MEFAPIIDAFKSFIPEWLIHSLIVIAFAIFIIGWVIPKIISVYKIGYSFGKKVNRLLGLADEFKNNGGSSLRDAIDRIENNIVVLGGKLNGLFFAFGENSGIITLEANKKGEIINSSKKWNEVTGLSEAETVGYGWLNGIHDKNKDDVYEAWKDAISQEREFHIQHSLFNRITSKKITVETYSLVVKNSKNIPLQYIMVMTPINDDFKS